MSNNNITKQEFEYEMDDVEQQFGHVLSNKQKNAFKGKIGEKAKKQKKFKKDKYL